MSRDANDKKLTKCRLRVRGGGGWLTEANSSQKAGVAGAQIPPAGVSEAVRAGSQCSLGCGYYV